MQDGTKNRHAGRPGGKAAAAVFGRDSAYRDDRDLDGGTDASQEIHAGGLTVGMAGRCKNSACDNVVRTSSARLHGRFDAVNRSAYKSAGPNTSTCYVQSAASLGKVNAAYVRAARDRSAPIHEDRSLVQVEPQDRGGH